MSKKKTKQQTQTLSPEKYIRQKSRSLPIYKCAINKSWEKFQFANIFITRRHASGNLTVCIYLADLACLGVKDTHYFFNIPVTEFEEMIKEMEIEMDDTISYSLAHNIIYAAIEFAEEYGFKPHKDYTQTTCYFLEEDTDDIPLIEIPCGSKQDGKPLYVNTGSESKARVKQIIDQLEKTAGEGNYNYITEASDIEDYYEDEYDDEYDDEYEEAVLEFISMPREEQVASFFNLIEKISKQEPSEEDVKQITILSNILAFNTIGEEAISEQLEKIEQQLDYPVIEMERFPNSLFSGIQNKDPQSVCNLFWTTVEVVGSDKDVKKALKEFQDEVGDIPVAYYMELMYCKENKKRKYRKMIEEYHKRFPDYLLIQILWNSYLVANEKDINKRQSAVENLNSLLSKSEQTITSYELEVFVMHYFGTNIMQEFEDEKDKLAWLSAFEKYISDNEFIDEDIRADTLTASISMKIFVLSYLLIKEKQK